MSVRSVLIKFNKCFLIFGIGSIKFNQGNFKTSVLFYTWRCLLIYAGLYNFYTANLWVLTIINFSYIHFLSSLYKFLSCARINCKLYR